MPLEWLGVKFGSGKQLFPILKHMSGVLRPVRSIPVKLSIDQ